MDWIASNTSLSFAAVSPMYFVMSPSSWMLKRGRPSSPASAAAVIVLPVPGGPCTTSDAPFDVNIKPQTPGSSFANRPKTGPPTYHRDGGGSDQRPEME